MLFKSSSNANQVGNQPFDTEDPHQQPNLSFLPFKSMPHDAWVTTLCRLFPIPKSDIPERGIVNVRQLRKDREKFVNVWIDRFIARGPHVKAYVLSHDRAADITEPAQLQFLEVTPDGMLRRGITPTSVHYAEPENESKEDLSDVAVSQVEWTNNPQLQADLRERWRLARPAKLTTGELEALLAKVKD